jgi:hypothetical protein
MLFVVFSVVASEMVHIVLVVVVKVYVANNVFIAIRLLMILMICLLLLPLASDGVCCSVLIDVDICHTAI